jgi:hypothetical protein
MSIQMVTFGPEQIGERWYCVLTTPNGESSVLSGPFDTYAIAWNAANDQWPSVNEVIRKWAENLKGKVISSSVVDPSNPS